MAIWTQCAKRPGGGLAAAGAAVVLAALAACQSAPKPPVSAASVIQAPSTCSDFKISIYFESYSAAITSQARQLIDSAVKRTKGCDVTGVHVTGLADAPGSPEANLILSKKRADAVTRLLDQRGIDNVAFLVAATGDAGAQTAGGQDKPLRRRADVQFHLAARPGTP